MVGRPCNASASRRLAASGFVPDTALVPSDTIPRFLLLSRLEYPDSLRQANIDGDVMASFTIDTLGQVVGGSERITYASHRYFGDAVCRALRGGRFTPFRSQKGPLSAHLVDFPFQFRIH
jgi:TonB family protein